jgi:hypothetical protein
MAIASRELKAAGSANDGMGYAMLKPKETVATTIRTHRGHRRSRHQHGSHSFTGSIVRRCHFLDNQSLWPEVTIISVRPIDQPPLSGPGLAVAIGRDLFRSEDHRPAANPATPLLNLRWTFRVIPSHAVGL